MTRLSVLLSVFLSITCVGALGGSYFTETHTATYVDVLRQNRSVPVRVTYPVDVSNGSLPVPVVVFSHGTFAAASLYSYLEAPVASEGIIFANYDGQDWLDTADAWVFAADLLLILQELPLDASFPLHGQIDLSRAVVAGHSEGGAATWVAANQVNLEDLAGLSGSAPFYTNDFTAGLTLSGCGDWPRWAPRNLSRDTIPMAVVSAQRDCLCPPSDERWSFGELASSCKYLVELTNATHCGFAGGGLLVEETCRYLEENAGTNCHANHTILSFDEQQETTVELILPWLRFVLGTGTQATWDDMLADGLSSGVILSYNNSCPSGF